MYLKRPDRASADAWCWSVNRPARTSHERADNRQPATAPRALIPPPVASGVGQAVALAIAESRALLLERSISEVDEQSQKSGVFNL